MDKSLIQGSPTSVLYKAIICSLLLGYQIESMNKVTLSKEDEATTFNSSFLVKTMKFAAKSKCSKLKADSSQALESLYSFSSPLHLTKVKRELSIFRRVESTTTATSKSFFPLATRFWSLIYIT